MGPGLGSFPLLVCCTHGCGRVLRESSPGVSPSLWPGPSPPTPPPGRARRVPGLRTTRRLRLVQESRKSRAYPAGPWVLRGLGHQFSAPEKMWV